MGGSRGGREEAVAGTAEALIGVGVEMLSGSPLDC